MSGHIQSKAELAYGKGETERADELYKDFDDLATACAYLQESGYKKFFGEILSFSLKMATINSLPMCEDEVHKKQEKFPGYRKSKVWN
ncbi:MAG: hypothetical protein WD509_00310 [Candidatus Paceibacterota bacterium]